MKANCCTCLEMKIMNIYPQDGICFISPPSPLKFIPFNQVDHNAPIRLECGRKGMNKYEQNHRRKRGCRVKSEKNERVHISNDEICEESGAIYFHSSRFEL